MGLLTGKTVIITGAGRAVLSDGSCGSIGYGTATAFEGSTECLTCPYQSYFNPTFCL